MRSMRCVSGEAVANVHPAEAEAGYRAVYAHVYSDVKFEWRGPARFESFFLDLTRSRGWFNLSELSRSDFPAVMRERRCSCKLSNNKVHQLYVVRVVMAYKASQS